MADNAIAYIDAASGADAPAALRKMAWAPNIMSLLGARAMSTISSLPVSRWERHLVHTISLGALSTLGSTAEREIGKLQTDVEQNTNRIRLRAKKLQGEANPRTRAGRAQAQARAARAAPGTRAAMLGSLFDFVSLPLKAWQAAVRQDMRSSAELGGQTLQAVGGWHALRAQAYAQTIHMGVRGVDVYTYKALQRGLDAINTAHLKSLRMTAFRFLGPAAAVFAVLDAMDAWSSGQRGQKGLAVAQAVSRLLKYLANRCMIDNHHPLS